MPGVRLRSETKRRDAPGESPLDVFLDEGSIPSGSTIELFSETLRFGFRKLFVPTLNFILD